MKTLLHILLILLAYVLYTLQSMHLDSKKLYTDTMHVLYLIITLLIIYKIYVLAFDQIFNNYLNNSSLLFVLIPNWNDSPFFTLLNRKYPFLFGNSYPLITFTNKSKTYIRKSRSKNVQLIESYTKASNRSYILTFNNNPLLESEALFVSIFKQTIKFLKNKNFGNNKSLLAQTVINGRTLSLHQNVKINNKTTLLDYWNLIKVKLNNLIYNSDNI